MAIVDNGASAPRDPNQLVIAVMASTVLQSKAVEAYGRRQRRVAYMYYQLDEVAQKISFSKFCAVMDETYPFMAQGLTWEGE